LVIIALFTPHCPCLIADKSIQLCGTQRLGFSCRAKVRVGRVGGRASMEISVVFATAQISDKSKQLPTSPLQTPFLLYHKPHDL